MAVEGCDQNPSCYAHVSRSAHFERSLIHRAVVNPSFYVHHLGAEPLFTAEDYEAIMLQALPSGLTEALFTEQLWIQYTMYTHHHQNFLKHTWM